MPFDDDSRQLNSGVGRLRGEYVHEIHVTGLVMRKSKTPLMQFLQKAFSIALTMETESEMFADDLLEKREANLYDRRQFITQMLGAVTVSGFMWSSFREIQAAPVRPKVAIIGAGIAGLNAAYQLQKRGFHATIYEASSTDSWGRIRTKKMANGLTVELGGEFIDSGHTDLLGLTREFNLSLIDTLTNTRGLIKDSYFFGGQHHTERQVIQEFRGFARKIAKQAGSLPGDMSYKSKVSLVKQLDHTSIEQYLQSLGIDGWLYDLLKVAYTSEFGVEIGHQSALNFITMIGTDLSRSFEVFGESDERYKIKGGNSLLIDILRQKLSRQIEINRRLEAISQRNNSYELSFAKGKDVDADVVVLAIPFTTLRHVDLSKVAFTERKMKAIKEVGYGTSSKLLLNVSARIWRKQDRSGYLLNEKVQNGWDNSLGQHKNIGDGGYTVFLGGDAGRNLDMSVADAYVNEIDKAFPTFKSWCLNNEAINWSSDELVKGGYACYKVGQWTSISGSEFEPSGNIFFCGEHCSTDYQGYMNGGAETGRRVAESIVKRFGIKTRQASRKYKAA
jgi:monoamine oxidase